jgi:hypothetical protein
MRLRGFGLVRTCSIIGRGVWGKPAKFAERLIQGDDKCRRFAISRLTCGV